jgi:hypothetical protein
MSRASMPDDIKLQHLRNMQRAMEEWAKLNRESVSVLSALTNCILESSHIDAAQHPALDLLQLQQRRDAHQLSIADAWREAAASLAELRDVFAKISASAASLQQILDAAATRALALAASPAHLQPPSQSPIASVQGVTAAAAAEVASSPRASALSPSVQRVKGESGATQSAATAITPPSGPSSGEWLCRCSARTDELTGALLQRYAADLACKTAILQRLRPSTADADDAEVEALHADAAAPSLASLLGASPFGLPPWASTDREHLLVLVSVWAAGPYAPTGEEGEKVLQGIEHILATL